MGRSNRLLGSTREKNTGSGELVTVAGTSATREDPRRSRATVGRGLGVRTLPAALSTSAAKRCFLVDESGNRIRVTISEVARPKYSEDSNGQGDPDSLLLGTARDFG
jgi:hypothetical protein